MRVAVIGSGAAGSAAAHALTLRGAKVQIFDQFGPGHERGASHGPTRLIRLAYFEKPDYVPMLRRAYELWRALENAVGADIFYEIGLLEAGPKAGGVVSGIRKAAAVHDIPLRELSPTGAMEKFPLLRLDQLSTVIEGEAGFIRADRALSAFQGEAQKNGAEFRWEETVTGLERRAETLILKTNKGSYNADRIIITPGPWADELFAQLGLRAPCPIAPVQKIHCWFAPGDETYTLENGFLPFGIEMSDGRFFYGFPSIDGDGVKVGEHTGGRPLSSPAEKTGALLEEEAAIVDFVKTVMPAMPTHVHKRATCLYEQSPDGDF